MQISLGKHILFRSKPIGILFDLTDNYDNGATNYRFDRQGMSNFNFLLNGGEMIVIFAMILISILAVFIVRLIFHKNENIKRYESRWRWEMLIKGFVLVYMQILICSLFNIMHFNMDRSIDFIAYVCAWFGLAFCILGYAGITAMTVWYKCLP
jgi:hypothetical protein